MRILLLGLLASCVGPVSIVDSGAVIEEDTDSGPVQDTAIDTGGDTSGDTGGDTGGIEVSKEPLELCINEFMPNNLQSWTDETGAYADWIELHNPGDTPVFLGGWSITDDAEEPDAHVFGDELTVDIGGFLVLVADGEPSLGPLHLDFRLDNEGEQIGLFRWDGTGEVLTYGKVYNDLSVARLTDCGPIDEMEYVYGGTPGVSNVAK